MFVGMITTVIVLLVISGIIASATYQTSGAIEQAHAAKIVSEISDIAKGSSMYKMTAKSYTGLSVTELNKLGIAPVIQVTTADNGFVDVNGSAVGENVSYIESKVNSNIGYIVESANNGDNFIIHVISRTANIKANEKYAIEKATVGTFENVDKGVSDSDGAMDITM